jgi:tripartite-type tricarboxylate transporter receptor subunit TctC
MRRGKTFAVALALTSSLAAAPSSASAQAWPSHPVTIIVPFAAGTSADIMGRSLTQYLSETLGQSFVIDNRGGAAGNIGATAVAHAPADGYTLLLATTGQAATNKLMYQNLQFDPEGDFLPVVLIGKSPVLITARADAPFSTLKELFEYARVNPEKINTGSPGNGTLGHITSILLQSTANIKFNAAVQYRGAPAIITDLIGKNIDLAFDSMAAYVPTVQSGQIKALAMGGSQRWPKLGNVATVSESGLPGFEATVWYALLAPAKTPPEVIARMNEAANAYLNTEKAKALFNDLGLQAGGGSPADLKAFIASEVQKWGPIIKAANIKF